eukprot:141332_1
MSSNTLVNNYSIQELKSTDNNNPLSPSEEEDLLLLTTHGYIKDKIVVTENTYNQIFITFTQKDYIPVKVKRVSKSAQDFSVCLKHATVLQHVRDKNISNPNLTTYCQHFQSESALYIVEEHIENTISLQDFIIKSQQLIKNGQLKLKDYRKCIKYLLFLTAKT